MIPIPAIVLGAAAVLGVGLALFRKLTAGPALPPAGTIPLGSGPTAPPKTGALADLARGLAVYLRMARPIGPDEQVRAYQTAAGLTPDGLYGPRTRDSLIAAGIENPPDVIVPAAVESSADPAELARTLGIELRTKGEAYDRETARRFQRAAKITVDGIVGPETAAALRRYGVEPPPLSGTGPAPSGAGAAPPAVVWTPAGPMAVAVTEGSTQTLVPLAPGAAGPGTPAASPASSLALDVAINLRTAGRSYDRGLVRKFQEAANAEGYRPPLSVDGIYGPKTRSAVITLGKLTSAPAVP